MAKKRQNRMPQAGDVASESILLAQLKEAERNAREALQENKQVLKELREERAKAEETIQGFVDKFHDFVSEYIDRELQKAGANLRLSVEAAQEEIITKLRGLTSALLGVPQEILDEGPEKLLTHKMQRMKPGR